MALTITIPGAVSTTTGSTAPAILTVGVGTPGAPGVGVPSGGSTGQYLVKASATSYDTAWLTLPANYITSVTAPLSVSSGNLSVNISAYLPLAGGTMTGDIQSNNNSAYRSYDGAYNTAILKADYLQLNTAGGGGGALTVESSGITFPSGKQTVHYPGSSILSGYATESWVTAGFYPLTGNPSGFLVAADITGKANLASPSLTGTPLSTTAAVDTNTTQIATTAYVVGQASSTSPAIDGTATVGTSLKYARADHVHPTDTSRAALASPTFTGTPLSTTAAVDTNTTQIATTAYVIGQGYAKLASPTFTGTPTLPTGTIATTQTALDSSTKLATTAFVTTADNLKANLASPTFTGTPTLPTGTIATTQTAGNNTTAVATTAFVTAAVPAIATDAQARLGQSKTVTSSPYAVSLALVNPSTYQWTAFNSATSGTGAANNNYGQYVYEQDSPNTLTAGYTAVYSNTQMSWVNGGSVGRLTFTKPVWISGKILKVGGYAGDANNSYRSYVGNTDTGGTPNGGDPVAASVGIKFTGGASQVFQLMVHNGTSQTLVSGTTTISTDVVYEWMVYSDGSGNATLFVNGTQEATTTAGPTGTASICYAVQAIGQSVTAVTRMVFVNRNVKVVVGN